MRTTPTSSSIPRAQRRVHQRICHRMLWSDAELQQLDALYAVAPKLWWHLPRVVRQQVRVAHRAWQLGNLHLVRAELLQPLALAPEPDALASALITALSTEQGLGFQRPWTSLRHALLALLRYEDSLDDLCPQPLPVSLGEPFRRLDTRDSLRTEGREMRSCIGQRNWWRETATGQGIGFALQRGDERATVWLRPPEEGTGLQVDMALGPSNTPLSAELRSWIGAQVDPPALRETDWRARRAELLPDDARPPVDERAIHDALEVLTGQLQPGGPPIPPRPARPQPFIGRSIEGLGPAQWFTFYQIFLTPSFGGGPDEGSEPPPSLRWSEAEQSVIYTTAEGEFALQGGLPIRLVPGVAEPLGIPALWMVVGPDDGQEPLPPEVEHARDQYLATLPRWLTDACAALEGCNGMRGLWLLSRHPHLVPFLTRFPVLAHAVCSHAHSGQAAPIPRLDGPEDTHLAAILAWLKVPMAPSIEAWVGRLPLAKWSLDQLHMLGRICSHVEALSRLAALPAPSPAQVVMIHAAWRAGHTGALTHALLNECAPGEQGWYTATLLGAVFDALVDHKQATGQPVPKLQSISHLVRLFVTVKPSRKPGFRSLALSGPWGAPAHTLEEVASLARDLGYEPEDWCRAAEAGLLVFSGVPLGEPTVTWLRPAGPRGHFHVVGTHTLGGTRAPAPVEEHLRDAIDAHNARIDTLPPGWGEADAVAAGLPEGLTGMVGRSGMRFPDQVGMLLSLRA